MLSEEERASGNAPHLNSLEVVGRTSSLFCSTSSSPSSSPQAVPSAVTSSASPTAGRRCSSCSVVAGARASSEETEEATSLAVSRLFLSFFFLPKSRGIADACAAPTLCSFFRKRSIDVLCASPQTTIHHSRLHGDTATMPTGDWPMPEYKSV